MSSKETSIHTSTDSSVYDNLFNKLDIKNNGEISYQDFKTALKELDHPIQHNSELIDKIFATLDNNKDNRIDLKEFTTYVRSTEDQIQTGFRNIDLDHDGRLDRDDFVKYLKSLNLQPTKGDVDSFFNQVDRKHDGYITYDEFRDFLILMPRLGGSRIKTAFQYIVEDMGISSDGDVTLTDQFLNGFGYFLAGGLAGVISRTCTAPFDRIKVFLIARADLSSTLLHSKKTISKLSNEVVHHLVPEDKIRSPLVKAARSLWRQGGIRAFYVGNGLNVIKVFPESAMKFGSFEAAKRFLARLEGVEDPSEISRLSTYLAGGFGGVISQFAVYPIDTLKFRVQCSDLDGLKGNALLFHTARDMFRTGGLSSFYRGWIVGVSGIFPYAALDLGTFSSIKKWYMQREAIKQGIPVDEVKLPNHLVLSLGALSGTFGATMVYPVNLLRTRLQAQGTYAHPYTYKGFSDVLFQTIKREGYPGLFKGLVPNLAKVAPAVSISYLVYENIKTVLELE